MSQPVDSTCPECGSGDIARVLWGMPVCDEEFARDLEAGRIHLAGCCVPMGEALAEFHCNACGCEFAHEPDVYERWKARRAKQLVAVVYGAAIGDALGVPYEFKARDRFTCTGMTGAGAHGMPAGTFSDDTSMLLATVDSIRECGGVDADDMRGRFERWLYQGAYTPDGSAFDVGNATATALDQGYGCDGERSNGNGSLMRIAPLAFTAADDAQIREVSAITHAHEISTTACVAFMRILRLVLRGVELSRAIEESTPNDPRFAFMGHLEDMPRGEVRSTGYVLDTLGAALWCALHSESYEECVLTAVNLGDDTDTTACVAGALAAAMYGLGSIPGEWLETLRGKEVIERCLGGE